jgi:hypothetical protein
MLAEAKSMSNTSKLATSLSSQNVGGGKVNVNDSEVDVEFPQTEMLEEAKSN